MKNEIRPSVKEINDIFYDLMMIGKGKINVDTFRLLSELRSGVFYDDSLDVIFCAFEIINILKKERNAGSKKQSIVIRGCVKRLSKICRYYAGQAENEAETQAKETLKTEWLPLILPALPTIFLYWFFGSLIWGIAVGGAFLAYKY